MSRDAQNEGDSPFLFFYVYFYYYYFFFWKKANVAKFLTLRKWQAAAAGGWSAGWCEDLQISSVKSAGSSVPKASPSASGLAVAVILVLMAGSRSATSTVVGLIIISPFTK
jgi:hypothetical protein